MHQRMFVHFEPVLVMRLHTIKCLCQLQKSQIVAHLNMDGSHFMTSLITPTLKRLIVMFMGLKPALT